MVLPHRVRRSRRSFRDLPAYLRGTRVRQEDLAYTLDISQVSVSRYARGVAIPQAAIAEKIASFCRIPITSFSAVYYRRRKEDAAA